MMKAEGRHDRDSGMAEIGSMQAFAPSTNDRDERFFTKALFKIGIGLALLAIGLSVFTDGISLVVLLFDYQDLPVLAFAACFLVTLYLRPDVLRATAFDVRSSRHLPIIVALVLVVAAAGTWIVFGNYPHARDEILANFDADFLKTGALIAPVPSEWRPFAKALAPLNIMPIADNAGWLSTYLPGNAMLRALADLIVGKEFANPLLAAFAVFVLYRVSRRLWPEAPAAAIVPSVLLATSPQFLANAMTPFAMTAHLAFNLVWLWCFLRDDRRGDAGALAAGFVATGLHQIVFHPVFVFPFIVGLLIARRWRRAALFIGGYALICLFWVSYWKIAFTVTGLQPPAEATSIRSIFYFFNQVPELVSAFRASDVLIMLLNLARFAAWQHLLLLPLLLIGWSAIRCGDGIARPLAAGVVLMLVMLLILLPSQGHGWGFRYLHGFLGSVCLLAGYGWLRIVEGLDRSRRDAALTWATALTVLIVLPFHLYNAHQLVKRDRNASAMIERATAEVVLVDATGVMFAQDLVRNAPDVSNRPRTLDIDALDEAQLRQLCSRYDVALFDRRHAVHAGIRTMPTEDFSGERRVLSEIGCGTPLPLD